MRSGCRGFPFKGERRYGRDALSNTSSECVVAKANEADCFANAEVQTREEGGKIAFDFRLMQNYSFQISHVFRYQNQVYEFAVATRFFDEGIIYDCAFFCDYRSGICR